MCTCIMSSQTLKEIPVKQAFDAMSNNGKYMINFQSSAIIGIYNTETDEYQEYSDPTISYSRGLGNMVTNDGYLVGAVNNKPSVLDIENKTWTPLELKDKDKDTGTAHAITQSRKYIAGYINIPGTSFGQLMGKPVIWTLKDDGTYGTYEELPYPEKDFTGAVPKYILINCISDDGTIIAAQIMMQDNDCLPLIYRKTQDGTWSYEVYDKGLCEPGLEFPEFPGASPREPEITDYMTEKEMAAYEKALAAYEDSIAKYYNHEIEKMPGYKPEKEYYISEESKKQYEKDYGDYLAESTAYSEKLRKYRLFVYENVTPNYYAQNSVWLSPNGKYYATTCRKNTITEDAAMITIDDNTELHDFKDGLLGYCVTDEGDLFVSDKTTAYVYPAGSTTHITLIDWLKSKGETEAAEWLSNSNTGIAICSGDGRVISGYSKMPGGYTSWIIKLDETPTGITGIEQSGNSHIKAYDLQGRIAAEGEYNEVRNNLKRGIYIINGRKVVVK